MNIKLNLLPEENKKEVRRGKRIRFIVWQGILCLVSLAFLAGIFISIYLMLSLRLDELRRVSDVESQGGVFQEINEAEKVFRDTNTLTSDVRKLQQEHIVWTRFFNELHQVIPEDVILEKIVTNNYTVSLSGLSKTRETLLQFQSKLNASQCFQNANLPLSDLFSQKDVQFQLDVEIKKECLKLQNI